MGPNTKRENLWKLEFARPCLLRRPQLLQKSAKWTKALVLHIRVWIRRNWFQNYHQFYDCFTKKQVLFWCKENDFWKNWSECDVPLCSECSCSKFGLGECRYSRETNFRRQCVCEDGAILHAGECISKDSDKIQNPNECQPEDDCGAGTCSYKAGNQYF